MAWFDLLDSEVSGTHGALGDLKYAKDEPMSRHTSFRVGGAARRMAFPCTTEQLIILMGVAEECGVKPFLMGNGTNLLVDDGGLDTLVVNTSSLLTKIESTDARTITAEAGASLARTALFACSQGLSGLAFAHGIPGSVGGGVAMNAGAYESDMSCVVSKVTALFPDGIRTLRGEELAFGYRRSIFTDHPEAVVLRAEFLLDYGKEADIRAEMDALMERRKKSQPLNLPSAGSFFKRPEGHFAGALIEGCGLKGAREGGAQVSEKHAGFVVNTGGATCADIVRLAKRVRETVYAQTGVTLMPEVKYMTGKGENGWKF